jgi:hypothetical protein
MNDGSDGRTVEELILRYDRASAPNYRCEAKGRLTDGARFEIHERVSRFADCLAIALGFPPEQVSIQGAMPIIEELWARKHATDNGYAVDARIFGTSMGGLRIPAINGANLLAAIGEYINTAWSARKHDVEVTEYEMTVNRGGRNAA